MFRVEEGHANIPHVELQILRRELNVFQIHIKVIQGHGTTCEKG